MCIWLFGLAFLELAQMLNKFATNVPTLKFEQDLFHYKHCIVLVTFDMQ